MIAMFTSTATALAYATTLIPNVTLMDVTVFITGLTLGIRGGALVGALSWTVYGILNPYGFNPAIWLATTASETIYGIAGGLARKTLALNDRLHVERITLLAAIGFITTFIYDLATNMAFAYVFQVPLILALAMGVPFALIHELSNMIIFASMVPPVARSLNNLGLGAR